MQVLRSRKQQIIYNVFNYIKIKTPKNNIILTASETAKGSGISRKNNVTAINFIGKLCTSISSSNLPPQVDTKTMEACFKT